MPRWCKITAFIVYLFVNIMYILKYVTRINTTATVIASVLFAALALFCLWRRSFVEKYSMPLLIIYTVTFAVGVTLYFPPGTFNMDRWDMIEVFNEALMAGEYPYAATGKISVCTPAQSPFYFLLCLPFYLTNFYVGISLTALWIFRYVEKKYFHSSLATVMLMLSAFMFYECMSLSSIIFNSVLVLWWMLALPRYDIDNLGRLVVHGLVGGLLLCTRNCYAIPMLIMGVSLLILARRKWQIVVWGLCILVTFAALYLPFVFAWGISSWNAVNPFTVQTSVILDGEMMAVILFISVVAGIFCRTRMQAVYWSGIIVFVAAMASWGEKLTVYDLPVTLFESRMEITYLIICMPFLMIFFNKTRKLER